MLFIVVLRFDNLPELAVIPLNEFGDFLAGVFGPLMMFWLILGFIQQQSELRQTTKALELQAKELSNSVEQHKELVKATQEQVSMDMKSLEIEQSKALRDSKPKIELRKAEYRKMSSEGIDFEIVIVNNGSVALEVKTHVYPEIKYVNFRSEIAHLCRGATQRITWRSAYKDPQPRDLIIEMTYLSDDLESFTSTFNLKLGDDRKYSTVSAKES